MEKDPPRQIRGDEVDDDDFPAERIIVRSPAIIVRLVECPE